jgi:23S rRNA pseudouridine1911/1915/1917 synthase
MPDSRVYHIRDVLDGSTLGQALKQLLRDQSWGDVKKLIANRHIQIHGNLCVDDARRLKTGDVVKVFDHPLGKQADADDIKVIFRDEHLVIVDKPAGVTTLRHADERDMSEKRKNKQPTLDEMLERVLFRKEKPKYGERPKKRFVKQTLRVRPVHRLDRDTSGLMVFAISPLAEQKLVEQFKHHDIDRVYRAVVHGKLSKPATFESDFVRDRGDGLRGSTQDPAAADRQRAVTHVKPIEVVGDFTVVECRLETGRTHQIRIHLAEAGHRLCGEKTYTHRVGEKPAHDTSRAPRHALHSCQIKLTHPVSEKVLHFQSNWPDDLSRWIKTLRASSTTV